MESKGDFFARAFEVVRRIPTGKVATYGQIARLIGEPKKARYVGFAMHSSPGVAGGVPCHRVVFKDGSLAPGFAFGGADAQCKLLEAEGVTFLSDGRVDMNACAWDGRDPDRMGPPPGFLTAAEFGDER